MVADGGSVTPGAGGIELIGPHLQKDFGSLV
jgi:hypothetical protein